MSRLSNSLHADFLPALLRWALVQIEIANDGTPIVLATIRAQLQSR